MRFFNKSNNYTTLVQTNVGWVKINVGWVLKNDKILNSISSQVLSCILSSIT